MIKIGAVRRTDCIGPEVSANQGKIGIEMMDAPPPLNEPDESGGQRCAVCGVTGPDLALACARCLEKATLFNGFRDQAAEAHEDTARLNAFEKDRRFIAGLLMMSPALTVREIIDCAIESREDDGSGN